MSSIFNFKQFAVDQNGSTMKINTDGVLLGAIASQDDPIRILDIGTGTGVIALMLAQRYPAAFVEAIEIDRDATSCATVNFEHSKFAPRLTAFHNDILDFETTHQYSLIVSNPPYHINSLQNPDKRKKLARHTDQSFLHDLVHKASALLAPGGSLWLILPLPVASDIELHAGKSSLSLFKEISVADKPGKQEVRQILGFSRVSDTHIKEKVYIRDEHGQYSETYQKLLKDFLTIF
jgi:tRNA1Val (adenine37-N6)-methyltransferase